MEIGLILILSDGKPGHLNQSIAFAKIKKSKYEISKVKIKPVMKILSYILDFFKIYIQIFKLDEKDFSKFKAVVSCGSETYYANKYIAKKYGLLSIATMLPKGFRYDDFDYIIAQDHDNPPNLKNIVKVPVNLSVSCPKGLVKKDNKKAIGIILGGKNSIFDMNKEIIEKTLDNIFKKYPEHLKYITTSRRTPKEVEDLLDKYEFDYKIIYSKNPDINPIPDFLDVCDILYITMDSTSMLSEAKANSEAKINIIELPSKTVDTKFHRLVDNIKSTKTKIELEKHLEDILI